MAKVLALVTQIRYGERVSKRTRSDWVSGTFKTSKDEFYEQRARQAREIADLERIQRERPLKPPTPLKLTYHR